MTHQKHGFALALIYSAMNDIIGKILGRYFFAHQKEMSRCSVFNKESLFVLNWIIIGLLMSKKLVDTHIGKFGIFVSFLGNSPHIITLING